MALGITVLTGGGADGEDIFGEGRVRLLLAAGVSECERGSCNSYGQVECPSARW